MFFKNELSKSSEKTGSKRKKEVEVAVQKGGWDDRVTKPTRGRGTLIIG
jgi:hypothetical protein